MGTEVPLSRQKPRRRPGRPTPPGRPQARGRGAGVGVGVLSLLARRSYRSSLAAPSVCNEQLEAASASGHEDMMMLCLSQREKASLCRAIFSEGTRFQACCWEHVNQLKHSHTLSSDLKRAA